jgi:hypothetical protein
MNLHSLRTALLAMPQNDMYLFYKLRLDSLVTERLLGPRAGSHAAGRLVHYRIDSVH